MPDLDFVNIRDSFLGYTRNGLDIILMEDWQRSKPLSLDFYSILNYSIALANWYFDKT